MRRNVRRFDRSGFILIVVLGAVVTLSALLFGFHHTMRTKLSTAHSFYRAEQAWNCARAGVNIAVAAIRNSDDLLRDTRFSKLASGEKAIPVADGTCSVTITEENGLLNVNRLRRDTGQLDRTRIDQFLRLIDLLNRHKTGAARIGYGIVPAIIDWIDPDTDVTHLAFVQRDNLGAEEDYYRTLDPPCGCANAPVGSLEELLRVRGVTPEMLGQLRDSLTTFGDGKVNVNAAPKLVLECLHEQMSPAVVQMILNRRQLKPFSTIVELKEVSGMTDNVYQAIKETISTGGPGRYYRVISRGTARDLSVTVEVVLQRNTQAGNVDILQYREL